MPRKPRTKWASGEDNATFERTSKRKHGYPAETQVKRGPRSVKAVRSSCSSGSATRTPARAGPGGAFKNCCRNSGRF
jgi:hypothetical protein